MLTHADVWQQVAHPHRFDQHMTQHRGSFHPRSDDLFIIGRFPAKDATGQVLSLLALLVKKYKF